MAYVCSPENLSSAAVAVRVAIRVAIRATTLFFLGSSTRNTTLGFVGKTFRREELLFTTGERKGSPTIGTFNRFVFETHR